MALLRNLYLIILITCARVSFSQPAALPNVNPKIHPPSPDFLFPRAQHGVITTQSTGSHHTWGTYIVTFWQSTAILPVIAAAHPLETFYQQAHLAFINAHLSQTVTHAYTYSLGALTFYVDTLDGSPIDWQIVLQFTSYMVGMTNRGWLNHYAAFVKNLITGTMIAVSVGVADGAAMWLNGGTSVQQFKNTPF